MNFGYSKEVIVHLIKKYELVASGEAGFYRVRALRDFADVTRGEFGGLVEARAVLARRIPEDDEGKQEHRDAEDQVDDDVGGERRCDDPELSPDRRQQEDESGEQCGAEVDAPATRFDAPAREARSSSDLNGPPSARAATSAATSSARTPRT